MKCDMHYLYSNKLNFDLIWKRKDIPMYEYIGGVVHNGWHFADHTLKCIFLKLCLSDLLIHKGYASLLFIVLMSQYLQVYLSNLNSILWYHLRIMHQHVNNLYPSHSRESPLNTQLVLMIVNGAHPEKDNHWLYLLNEEKQWPYTANPS